MSGSGLSPEYSPQNPVRIVYRAGNRTFARLFNERSLKEVKDVVRRKLGLGLETDVSLKQMGLDTLLDLDDDDDFQAFRVFLRSSASVDIQVTVGESRGAAVSPPTVASTATPQPQQQPIASEPARFPSPGPSRVTPESVTAARVQISSSSPELVRKRKVSSGDTSIAHSSKPMERGAPVEPIIAAPLTSEKSAKSPAPQLEPSVEPPKKKQRKEPTKAKPTEHGILPKTTTVAPDTPPGSSSELGSAGEGQQQPLAGMRMPIKMRKDTLTAFQARFSKGAESPQPEATSEVPKQQAGEVAAKKSMPKDSGEPMEPVAGVSDPSARVVEPGKPETTAETPKRLQMARRSYGDAKFATKSDSAAGTSAKSTVSRGYRAPRKMLAPMEDVQIAHAPGSPLEKASASVSKKKPKKAAILDRGDDAGTGAQKDTESSEVAVKKKKKQNKEDGIRSKKLSAPADQDGTDKLIGQPSDSTSRQPEVSVKVNAEGDAAEKYTQAPKGMVCASIPQTSASKSVRSEVAAAILSGHLSILPKPTAKGKSVKRDTKKPSASSNAVPVESTTVLDTPANEVPNALAEVEPEHVVLTNELPRQTPDLNGPPCPICLGEPFHIRYYCPVVLKGPGAIRERIEDLKKTSTDDQQSLIKELDGLLRESEVTSKPSLSVANDVQSDNVPPPSNVSSLGAPSLPGKSALSGITVEGKDDGSTSDSSDDVSIGEAEPQESPGLRTHRIDKQPLPSNNDLEAIVRGPAPKRKSILRLLDRIVGDKDGEDSRSEEDQTELEEDTDEEISQSISTLRALTRVMRSSDSESEGRSGSSSPSCSAEDAPTTFGPSVESLGKSVAKSAEHKEGDVVIADPPVLQGQDDDSSEETHVGSEDRMAVDESIGEKGRISSIGEEFSAVFEVLLAQPSDVPSEGPQGSTTTRVHPTSDRDGGILVATEVLKETEADPIEPADDLEPAAVPHSLNADLIEAPSEDNESFFNSLTQSTPMPGVSKRIKTRSGQILDDETDHPILLGQLALEVTTPAPEQEKSRTKASASQELVPTRKSPRFGSLPPATITPAVVAPMNHGSKPGIRTDKGAKTLVKQPEERPDGSSNMACIAPTPSLARWETLAEPSSPSVQLDEASLHIDELMASGSHPEDDPIPVRPTNKSRPRKVAPSDQTQSVQGKERLFDLSSSQIPFPYSQDQAGLTLDASLDGNESEGTTGSEDEPLVKRLAQAPTRFRSLSQLASTAVLYSPSLPTATKSVTNGKTKKCAIDEESSSSSSSSDADHASGSGHIPRGRKAGVTLKTKGKSALSNLKF